jgi:hypothetical protein
MGEGYRGRFTALRWGTPLVMGLSSYIYDSTTFFNNGEFRAWSYGPALVNYVQHLKTTMGADTTMSIIGHSLGNAVVGSALQKGMMVDNYVAMQAAVPLSCYFPPPTDPNYDPLQISFFQRLLDAEQRTCLIGPDVMPDYYTDMGYRGYLSNLKSTVSSNLVNYHNENDFWLATGFTSEKTPIAGRTEVSWIRNEVENKGFLARQYVYDLVHYLFYPDRAEGQRVVIGQYIEGILRDRRPVADAHESMAYFARSRTRALGAEPANGNPKPPNWRKSLDLGADYGFTRSRYDHSGQFLRDIQLMYSSATGKKWAIPLYRQLLMDLKAAPANPPK